MFQLIFFSILNGLVYGMLLFMLSSGLTLIFGMMGVLNFAHASFYMLGAYFAFTLGLHLGFWPALVIAPVLVGLLGALVERQGLRRVHGFGHIAELIFTFGVAILIEEVVQLVWGRPATSSQVPALLDFPLFRVMSSSFPAYKAFMLVVAIAIFGFIFVILTRTRAGLIIQASLTHPQMVAMLGHNVPRVFMIVFGIGSALAALAGVIAGPVLGTFPGMAQVLGSIVFVVVVIGGLGSLSGAFVASLLIGIVVIFALSFNMLLGQGGMLSFGHAVYFGLGGFIAAHVLNMAGRGAIYLPVPLLPLVGGLGGLAFAALFGSFSTRRAGTVFSMISLGVAELMAASSLIFDKFFGGEEGITTNRSKAPLLLGLEFTRDRQVYYLIAFWLFVATLAMYAFSRTPVGRMANAVRDNPERAEFVGYSQHRVRFVSFCAAGFFAGIAGGLFAVNYEILTAENMGLNASGAVLLMAYIGGIGAFVGPIVGAVVFTFLQSMLSDYTGMWLLYLGILFLATVLFVPAGFAGVLMLHAPAWRARRLGRLLGPYLLAGLLGLVVAVGVVGLLEMIHGVVSAPAGRTAKRLFWMTVDVRTLWPWLAFATLAVAGAVGLRWAAPQAAKAFTEASRPVETR